MKLEFVGVSEDRVNGRNFKDLPTGSTREFRYKIKCIDICAFGIQTLTEYRMYINFCARGKSFGCLSYPVYDRLSQEEAEYEIQIAVESLDFCPIRGLDGVYYIQEHLFRSQTGYALDTNKRKILEMDWFDAINMAYATA